MPPPSCTSSEMRHTGGASLEGPARTCWAFLLLATPWGLEASERRPKIGRKRPLAVSERGEGAGRTNKSDRLARPPICEAARCRAKRDHAGPSGAVVTESSRRQIVFLALCDRIYRSGCRRFYCSNLFCIF